MAEDGSWPSIQARGLLPTSALLTLYGYSGPRREAIESQWRRTSVTIRRPGLPNAVIRDQLVMPPDELAECLSPGLTPEEWYRIVNGRVFFWTTDKDLARFLSARSYVGSAHVVIEVQSDRLIERRGSQITLTAFNTGSTLHGDGYAHARIRGRETFERIESYTAPWVKELVVESGIPDVSGLVSSVKRCVARTSNWSNPKYEVLETLWPAGG
ncbi:MAG: hypothetical protein L3K18_03565 [Thermoplasmata archaeon]|nr:hypothetical protein [Thermoplasmata archaeon]